ncbi:OVCH1 [Branchiostoma lanceolatum]|uniref:OVCH1 protein n=1 Tax=Branchiostoma lanceolatum TaxID=7740 RepID=A0A8K0EFT6_BRALA|nr:OVCH1 [Branchiostoma lanceolatum]
MKCRALQLCIAAVLVLLVVSQRRGSRRTAPGVDSGDEECSGVYRGDVGDVLSPGWPQVYPNNRYCVYHVSVTPGRTLTLTFNSLELQDRRKRKGKKKKKKKKGRCSDGLSLYDGGPGSTRRGETCGRPRLDPFKSSSHEVVLVFRSDGSVQRNGFNVTYTSSGCGNPAIPRTQWVVPGSRVVGGTEAEPGSWPWQVSLRPVDDETWHFCGGSIISEEWVVTAAHCVDGDYKPLVVVGEHTREDEGDDPERAVVATATTINHPDFNWWTMVNDVALLKLASPLTFSDRVSPLCLADSSMVTSPTTFCTITGWGTMAEGGDCCPNELQQADVPIVEDDHCKQTYQQLFRQSFGLVPMMRPARHLCAGYTEGGVDSCQGDSGGPLTCQAPDGTYYQAGVVSYGEGCGQENIPGVYTRVTSVYEWIRQTIEGN